MQAIVTVANFKGQQVFVGETVTAERGGKQVATGWIAVTLADGSSAKARAKDLSDIREVKQVLTCDDEGNEVVAEKSERKNGVVDARYLDRYVTVKLDNGATVKDNGDDVAQLLRGMELVEIYELASAKLGIDMSELTLKYEHLNPGQQRMNLGNRLRKAFRDADRAYAVQQ